MNYSRMSRLRCCHCSGAWNARVSRPKQCPLCHRIYYYDKGHGYVPRAISTIASIRIPKPSESKQCQYNNCTKAALLEIELKNYCYEHVYNIVEDIMISWLAAQPHESMIASEQGIENLQKFKEVVQ